MKIYNLFIILSMLIGAKQIDRTANDILVTGDIQGTLYVSKVGSEFDPVDVDGHGFSVQCIAITGSYTRVHGFVVTGCKVTPFAQLADLMRFTTIPSSIT